MRKQRSSLVMTKVDGVKTVLGCSGMVYETGVGAAGYCFAFDVATNKLTAMLPLTAGEGAGAGVWMGGQGAAADDQGNLYLITLNGDFDGETQWGKSFSKLRYTPAANGRRRTSLWVDHWTPWTDFARSVKTAHRAGETRRDERASESVKRPVGGGMAMPLKNAKLVAGVNDRGIPTLLVYPDMATGAWADEDWDRQDPHACLPSAYA